MPSLLQGLLSFTAQSLFNTFFPAECRLCGDPLTNLSRLPCCGQCLQQVRGFDCVQCQICGELLISRHAALQAEPVCGLCQKARPAFERAVSCGPYDGKLRELIHLLKYEQVRSAARPIGERLAQAVMELREETGDGVVVIPVPLHRRRQGFRGFNQAHDIAAALVRSCRKRGWELQLLSDGMKRLRATTSQTGLTRHQRRENVRGAFAVERPQHVRGRNVLLVDDVLTTGTTAQECAKVLRRAGAEAVWVATAARVSRLSLGDSFLQAVAAGRAGEGFGSKIQQEEMAAAATGNAAG